MSVVSYSVCIMARRTVRDPPDADAISLLTRVNSIMYSKSMFRQRRSKQSPMSFWMISFKRVHDMAYSLHYRGTSGQNSWRRLRKPGGSKQLLSLRDIGKDRGWTETMLPNGEIVESSSRKVQSFSITLQYRLVRWGSLP